MATTPNLAVVADIGQEDPSLRIRLSWPPVLASLLPFVQKVQGSLALWIPALAQTEVKNGRAEARSAIFRTLSHELLTFASGTSPTNILAITSTMILTSMNQVDPPRTIPRQHLGHRLPGRRLGLAFATHSVNECILCIYIYIIICHYIHTHTHAHTHNLYIYIYIIHTYVYASIHPSTYIHTNIQTYKQTNIHTYIHIYIYIYLYIYIYIYIHTYLHTYYLPTYIHTLTCIHWHAYIDMHALTCMHWHTYIDIHTLTTMHWQPYIDNHTLT